MRDRLSPSEHRRRLISGLVGPRGSLYHLSPSFRAGIDGLASLLPAMIDGLAAQAAEADRRHLTLERLAGLEGFTPSAVGWPDLARVITGDDTTPDSEKLDRAAREGLQSGRGAGVRDNDVPADG